MKNVTEKFVNPVNETYLKSKKEINVDIVLEEVEMDEMWSFYHDKKHQVWLWWAVEHQTNTPTAFVFGTREHKYLDELIFLLKPYSIGKIYTDNNFAYSSRIAEDKLIIGKKNTQKILIFIKQSLVLSSISFSITGNWTFQPYCDVTDFATDVS